jgi:hypothetical protein
MLLVGVAGAVWERHTTWFVLLAVLGAVIAGVGVLRSSRSPEAALEPGANV